MRKLFVLLAFLLAGSQAHAQATTEICVRATPTGFCQAVNTTTPLPVTNAGSGGTLDVNINEVNGAAPSAANPLPGSINEGGNTATVKAASTPSEFTDPALVVSLRPEPGPVSTPGCTVGVASAQCIAGLTTARWLQIQNVSVSATVACAWGGAASLNASSSFMLAAGQAASWGFSTGGVPNEVLNCISSVAATPLYVEYK